MIRLVWNKVYVYNDGFVNFTIKLGMINNKLNENDNVDSWVNITPSSFCADIGWWDPLVGWRDDTRSDVWERVQQYEISFEKDVHTNSHSRQSLTRIIMMRSRCKSVDLPRISDEGVISAFKVKLCSMSYNDNVAKNSYQFSGKAIFSVEFTSKSFHLQCIFQQKESWKTKESRQKILTKRRNTRWWS